MKARNWSGMRTTTEEKTQTLPRWMEHLKNDVEFQL